MAKLSDHLQALAKLAWEERLRGRSWEKNSLMAPIDEVFVKLNQWSDAFDEEALRALIEDLPRFGSRLLRQTEKRVRRSGRMREAVPGLASREFEAPCAGSLAELRIARPPDKGNRQPTFSKTSPRFRAGGERGWA